MERSRAFASKDAAAAHLAAVDVAVRSGSYVGPSRVTVEVYAKAWLGHQLHHRASTAEQAARMVNGYLVPALGSLPVAAVTRADVQGLVSGATALGPSARRVLYVYVRAIFAAAVEDRLIVSSPCRRIRLPELVEEPVVPLSVAQVRAIAGRMGERWRAAVWLAAGTGLRPGELRGLTVDRVRDEGRVVLVDDGHSAYRLAEVTGLSEAMVGRIRRGA